MNITEEHRRAIEKHLSRVGVPLGEGFRFDHFGNTANLAAELGALVASGRKTATAAYDDVYSHYKIERPQMGDTEIICDFAGSLLAVIEISDLRVIPFEEVGADHARLEGEGDRSLEHWRRIHREYFEAEGEAIGVPFSDGSLILCQRFRLVYSPPR